MPKPTPTPACQRQYPNIILTNKCRPVEEAQRIEEDGFDDGDQTEIYDAIKANGIYHFQVTPLNTQHSTPAPWLATYH